MRATLLTTIILAITGDPGTHVQGRCIVDPTAQTVEIDTTVPYVRSFDGAGLRCTFEAAGRAVVEAEKNGSRSRSTTNGGRITSMSASVTLSRREREASERERVRGERPAMHSPLTPPLSQETGRTQGAYRTPLSVGEGGDPRVRARGERVRECALFTHLLALTPPLSRGEREKPGGVRG